MSSARLVIIDDDPLVVRLLEAVLEEAGYRNVWSTSVSTEALDLCAQVRPDAVLLDVRMPPPDGLDLLQALKPARTVDAEFLPVIMLTGDESEQTRRRALALGATDFLTKPLDVTEVLLRLGNALMIRRHHVQLEQQVQLRTGELELARLELLHRLALMAEFRDDETHQHTRRVGRAAYLLAQVLAPAEAELIRLAAPLHDVGKVGIPDAILLKPGRLTRAEYERMQQHTTIGQMILHDSTSAVLRVAEEIAHSHHERWGGQGYPRGLERDAICLSGRITAVADAFDALTHDRPYKQATPLADALAEIVRSAGTQFDPDVVEVFADLPHDELVAPP